MNKMNWAYSIKQKTISAVVLALVLGMVWWISLDQNKQFEKMANAFTSLYEDRLLAENQLYHLSESVQQKINLLDMAELSEDANPVIKIQYMQLSRSMVEHLRRYKQTKFTAIEQQLFDTLRSVLGPLLTMETAFWNGAVHIEPHNMRVEIKQSLSIALQHLSHLSDLQVTVGKQLNMESRAALQSNAASSQFLSSFLIIIGIIIQMLIFASKSIHSPLTQKPHLN